MIARLAHIRRADEGTTAVEMAVVMMAVLFLILGTIEFAIAYWTMHSLQLAVDVTGRQAMVYHTLATPAAAESYMQQYFFPSAGICTTPSSGQYCVNVTQSNSTNTMTLTASYGFDIIGITGGFTLAGQTTVPLD